MDKTKIALILVGALMGAGGSQMITSGVLGGYSATVRTISVRHGIDGGTEIETCGDVQSPIRKTPARRCDVRPADSCAMAWVQSAPGRLVDAQKLGEDKEKKILSQLDGGK